MAGEVVVHLESLGLCEHCGELLTLESMPLEAMDAIWRCPACNGVLEGESFGYEGRTKVRWVGPGKTWVTEKPTKDSELGNLDVFVDYKVTYH